MQTVASVQVAPQFVPYVAAAVHRLRYLYPKLDFQWDSDANELVATSVEKTLEHGESLRREINYALYREKIFSDTLTIRQKIVGAEGTAAKK